MVDHIPASEKVSYGPPNSHGTQNNVFLLVAYVCQLDVNNNRSLTTKHEE